MVIITNYWIENYWMTFYVQFVVLKNKIERQNIQCSSDMGVRNEQYKQNMTIWKSYVGHAPFLEFCDFDVRLSLWHIYLVVMGIYDRDGVVCTKNPSKYPFSWISRNFPNHCQSFRSDKTQNIWFQAKIIWDVTLTIILQEISKEQQILRTHESHLDRSYKK